MSRSPIVVCGYRQNDNTAQELDRLLAFYRRQLEGFEKDEKAADEVVKGHASRPANAAEQAAWTMVANALLNLDETVTKE